MEYVQYGKTGLKVSRLGLGCMRLPTDEKDAIEMIRYAIDNGINYLDTAYTYKDSEVITGRALREGYRNKIHLATKSPIRKIERYEDFEKYLDEELKRLGTDYIDVYLLHGLGLYGGWEKVKKYDGLTFLDRMIQKGKIRHKAFSVHTSLQTFKEIVDSFDWEMAQIQLNILGEEQQVGVEGLKYAADKGIATVVMEPLRGGSLLINVPSEVNELIKSYPEQRSLVEWCFRWLKDNLRIFEHAEHNTMSEEDLNLIVKIREAFESIKSIGCTGCKYCMPCPQGVKIPEIFKVYNSYQRMKPKVVDKLVYQSIMIPSGAAADQCVSCGLCEQQCPQGLPIPDLLKKVHEEFTES